jgi:hypothetical protein
VPTTPGKRSPGPHKHQNDEESESEDMRQFSAEVIAADRNDLAHNEGGDKTADHIAQAAKDADHEDQRSECIADEWMHVILQYQKTRGAPRHPPIADVTR